MAIRALFKAVFFAGVITQLAPNPYGAPVAVPTVPHFGNGQAVVPLGQAPGIRPIPQIAPLGQRCRQQFVPGVGWQQVCW